LKVSDIKIYSIYDRVWLLVDFGLIIPYIVHCNEARDYTLVLHVHGCTHVHAYTQIQTQASAAMSSLVLIMDSDPGITSQKLQTSLEAMQKWLKKLRIKANKYKSVHVTFTT
jgi:hypothetical protein